MCFPPRHALPALIAASIGDDPISRDLCRQPVGDGVRAFGRRIERLFERAARLFDTLLMFRRVFERVVEACIAAGLVGGEGFAVDASLIVADANKQRSIPGTEWKKTCLAETASRATREYLGLIFEPASRTCARAGARARAREKSL